MIVENEEEMVKQAQEDPQAFVHLYDRYVDRIFAYAQRETKDTATAQDVVSATFEKALIHLPSYEWKGVSFGAWLYQIARNEIRMIWRKQKWIVPFMGIFSNDKPVEQLIQSQNTKDEIQQRLCQLSGKDQEILRLRYYEDLSPAEIAKVLDCSPNNAAVRIHRALKQLRKQMITHSVEVLSDVS